MNDICSGKEFIEKREWPNFTDEKPSDAFAFAQHPGLPTMLLDWTRTPWFAAFFAADSNLGIEMPASDKRPNLAVWAANLKLHSFGNSVHFSLAFDRAFYVFITNSSEPDQSTGFTLTPTPWSFIGSTGGAIHPVNDIVGQPVVAPLPAGH